MSPAKQAKEEAQSPEEAARNDNLPFLQRAPSEPGIMRLKRYMLVYMYRPLFLVLLLTDR